MGWLFWMNYASNSNNFNLNRLFGSLRWLLLDFKLILRTPIKLTLCSCNEIWNIFLATINFSDMMIFKVEDTVRAHFIHFRHKQVFPPWRQLIVDSIRFYSWPFFWWQPYFEIWWNSIDGNFPWWIFLWFALRCTFGRFYRIQCFRRACDIITLIKF